MRLGSVRFMTLGTINYKCMEKRRFVLPFLLLGSFLLLPLIVRAETVSPVCFYGTGSESGPIEEGDVAKTAAGDLVFAQKDDCMGSGVFGVLWNGFLDGKIKDGSASLIFCKEPNQMDDCLTDPTKCDACAGSPDYVRLFVKEHVNLDCPAAFEKTLTSAKLTSWDCTGDEASDCQKLCKTLIASSKACEWKEGACADTPPASGGVDAGTTPAGAASDVSQTVVSLINPLGGTVAKPTGLLDMRVLLGKIIAYAMGLIGSVTLVVFVYGGFMFITAAGDEEKFKKGQKAMGSAGIGLFIIFAAYGILQLVIQGLGATGGKSLEGIQLTPIDT